MMLLVLDVVVEVAVAVIFIGRMAIKESRSIVCDYYHDYYYYLFILNYYHCVCLFLYKEEEEVKIIKPIIKLLIRILA